jgi:hypothetical protein
MEEVKKLTATQLKMYAKRLDAIRADLQSENTTTILRALEKLKEYGNASIITELVDLLLRNSNEEVHTELRKLFFSIRDKEAVLPIIENAKRKEAEKHRSFLISCLWESGLNVEPHFETLLDLALAGDYLTVLEVYTNMDSMSFPGEERLELAIVKLQGFLSKPSKDKEKDALLHSMMQSLQEMLLG